MWITDFGEVERPSERSDVVGQLPPIGVVASGRISYCAVVSVSIDEVACGSCGRRVRRPRWLWGNALSATAQLPPSVSRAFPWHRQDPQAVRARRERRASRGRDRHVVSFRRLAGASCVRRIERPLSSMRCASWSRRSQMASAWLGSPMTACQSVTGSWSGDERRGAFGAVLDHLDEVSPLGVAQRREHPVVDREQVELGQAASSRV